MKQVIIFIFLLISCSQKETVFKTNRIEPPIIEFDKNLNVSFDGKEYFYYNTDSSKRNLLKTTEYYSKDKLATETHNLTSSETQKGTKFHYDYKDSLLVQLRSIDVNNDSSKVLYFYDEKKQLARREHYNFKKRLLPETIEKFKKTSDLLLSDDDYEEKRTWDKISEIHFKYDLSGKKIEYNAPDLHWDRQNRYTWSYNENGKILTHKSFDKNRLIWTENYTYNNEGYKFVRKWDQESENKTHYEYHFRITNKGREIEKLRIENGIKLKTKTISKFNEMGLISKIENYNDNNELLLTHVFEYSN